jgi:hypothetical protein
MDSINRDQIKSMVNSLAKEYQILFGKDQVALDNYNSKQEFQKRKQRFLFEV